MLCKQPTRQKAQRIRINQERLTGLLYRNADFRQQIFRLRRARVVQVTFVARFVTQRATHLRQLTGIDGIVDGLEFVIRAFINEAGITSCRNLFRSDFPLWLNGFGHHHTDICAKLLFGSHLRVIVIDAKRTRVVHRQVLAKA